MPGARAGRDEVPELWKEVTRARRGDTPRIDGSESDDKAQRGHTG